MAQLGPPTAGAEAQADAVLVGPEGRLPDGDEHTEHSAEGDRQPADLGKPKQRRNPAAGNPPDGQHSRAENGKPGRGEPNESPRVAAGWPPDQARDGVVQGRLPVWSLARIFGLNTMARQVPDTASTRYGE